MFSTIGLLVLQILIHSSSVVQIQKLKRLLIFINYWNTYLYVILELDVVKDLERGKTHYISIDGERKPMTFPKRKLFRIDYDLAGVYGGFDIFESLKNRLVSLLSMLLSIWKIILILMKNKKRSKEKFSQL